MMILSVFHPFLFKEPNTVLGAALLAYPPTLLLNNQKRPNFSSPCGGSHPPQGRRGTFTL